MFQLANQHLPDARRRMDKYLSLFRKLWRAASIVMDKCLSLGVSIAIVWPKSCTYWHVRTVRAFIRKQDLKLARFHGCASGMMDHKRQGLQRPCPLFLSRSRSIGAPAITSMLPLRERLKLSTLKATPRRWQTLSTKSLLVQPLALARHACAQLSPGQTRLCRLSLHSPPPHRWPP